MMQVRKGHRKKALTLDLDGRVEDAESEGLAMQVQKENKEFQKLKKKMVSCNKCGPEKWCKVNKLGMHVHLTAPQLGGWAHVLVCVFSSVYNLAIQ